MGEVRILQLSDILIGSKNIDAEKIFEELADFVDENSPGDQLYDVIDYIVVCGNLTVDGSRENYEKAHNLLTRVSRNLLVKDTPQNGTRHVRFNRVIIVPGRADISLKNGFDFHEFKNFHDRFFAEEIQAGRVTPFKAGSSNLRMLKDLAFIGVSYWETGSAATNKEMMRQFRHELQGVVEKIREDYASEKTADKIKDLDHDADDYYEYIPRLLISAAYPLYSYENKEVYEDIKTSLQKLKISLQLFGSGNVAGVLPEPFGLGHVALGTGPRSPKESSFRANLLQMWLGSQDPFQPVPRVTNYSFRQLEKCRMEGKPHIKGHLDLFLEPPATLPRDENIYDPILKTIETAIFEDGKKFIFVSGLPGSGKQDFFKLLEKQTGLGAHPVRIVSLEIDRYDQKYLRNILNAKKKLIKEILAGETAEIIIAVRDTTYHTLDNDQKGIVREFLTPEKAQDFFIPVRDNSNLVKAVLYFVSTPELELQLEPVKTKTKKIKLAALGNDSIKVLVKQYVPYTPVVRYDELKNYTGGFAGFSRRLLDAAKSEFEQMTGSEPINRHTGRQLIRRAIANERIKEEARDYLNVIEVMPGGRIICSYVKDKIRKQLNIRSLDELQYENTKIVLPPLKITVSLTELKEVFKDSRDLIGINETFEQLIRLNIFKKNEHSDDTFDLRITFPFFYESQPLPDEAQTERAPGEQPEESQTVKKAPPEAEEKADILILTALPEELDSVLGMLENPRRLDPVPDDIYVYYAATIPIRTQQGTVGSCRAVVTSSLRMGHVQATALAVTAIRRWKPKYVFLVGIAAGFPIREVRLGDILIADQIFDYELQKLKKDRDELRPYIFPVDAGLLNAVAHFTAEEYRNQLPPNRPQPGEPKIRQGMIASGNNVDARGEIIAKYGKEYPKLIGIEMEAAGVAAACLNYPPHNPKFFMVRGVSDFADPDKNTPEVERWRPYACDIASAYAIAFIKSGLIWFDRQ